MKQFSFEYIIGSIGPSAYTVSKFEIGEPVPLEVYSVDMSKPTKPCACPAWKSGKTRPCKHGGMVTAYINAGEPPADSYRIVGVGKDWVFSRER